MKGQAPRKWEEPDAAASGFKELSASDKGGGFTYKHPRESDEDHRWRCMKRNMRYSDALTKDGAQKMLENARKLTSCNDRDLSELQEEYNLRFGSFYDSGDE